MNQDPLLVKAVWKSLMMKNKKTQENLQLFLSLSFLSCLFSSLFVDHLPSPYPQAYQSVIIGVTFVLTVIFFRYTFLMYGNIKKKNNAVKQFVIVVGGSFNVAFLVRTGFCFVFLFWQK